MGQIPLPACARMRELLSASLDGELSELDEVRLQDHLVRCSGCRAYAATADATARLVRHTPLEQPSFAIVARGCPLAPARKLKAPAAGAAVAPPVGLSSGGGTIGGPWG